jgi:DNA-damage-inducible protein D
MSKTDLAVTQLDVFHFQEDRPNFESFAKENGIHYWLASDLAAMLGYSDTQSTKKAINKAVSVCMTLNIPVIDNFQQVSTDADPNDFKLSRFACYLTVMNGDVRNEKVAKAQAYFVGLAEAFQEYIQEADSVERVLIRGEVSAHEKSLSSTAKQQGIENYAFFQSAGYRGLYNMSLGQLKAHKGLQKGNILDFMGKEELAANLFRITQTESKIRKDRVSGQRHLEHTAESVGKEVRQTMIRISGTRPESLALEGNIVDVRKGIKVTHKELRKLDAPKKRKSK